MFTEQIIPAGLQSLNTAVGPPNGSPTMLLHGVVRCWQDFSTVLPVLAAGTHAFVVDHRGHGRSSRANRYLVADYIQDAIAVVRTFETPPILIGHSLGALVAIGVAASLPDRIRAIVLEDPPSANFLARIDGTINAIQWQAMQSLAGSDRPVRDTAIALADVQLPGGLRMGDLRDAAALRFLARCLRDLDAAVLTPLLEGHWLDGFDPLAAAARVRCPTLILAADMQAGGMLSVEDADQLEVALADPVRINLPKVGHLIHVSCPDQYLRLTLNFLDSLEPLAKRP